MLGLSRRSLISDRFTKEKPIMNPKLIEYTTNSRLSTMEKNTMKTEPHMMARYGVL